MGFSTSISPEARALLETISGPESKGAYDVIYGGTKFNDFSAHPSQPIKIKTGPNKGKFSSAAGKYQFIEPTWNDIAKKAGLQDFSPESQDKAAWYLAQEEYKRDTGRDLQSDLKAGDLSRVPSSLRNQWTSMPGGIEQGIGSKAFGDSYNAALAAAAKQAGFQFSDIGNALGYMGGAINGGMNGLGNAVGNLQQNGLPVKVDPMKLFMQNPGAALSMLFGNAGKALPMPVQQMGGALAGTPGMLAINGGQTVNAAMGRKPAIPVGTNLGFAANGGTMTQGKNGILNSKTQESSWWQQATGNNSKTGKSSSSGGGGGGYSLTR